MFNNKFRIGVLKHPGYNGGGKGGSTSTSQPVDLFGKDKRAPYESLLRDLLLGGPIGGTEGHYANAAKGGGRNKNQGAWIPGTPGLSIADYIKQTPGYQFGMDQGTSAVERSFASKGFGSSGAESLALLNFGNQYANQQYQQLISNLMAPAGVGAVGQSTTTQSGGSSLFGTILGAGLSMMGNPFAAAGGAGALGMGGSMVATAPSAGGLAWSDRTLKRDIKLVDIINGYKVYTYKYIWSNKEFKGVMAQDLLETNKDAVTVDKSGYYMVDYSKLGV